MLVEDCFIVIARHTLSSLTMLLMPCRSFAIADTGLLEREVCEGVGSRDRIEVIAFNSGRE